jgi:hypothetical protein
MAGTTGYYRVYPIAGYAAGQVILRRATRKPVYVVVR